MLFTMSNLDYFHRGTAIKQPVHERLYELHVNVIALPERLRMLEYGLFHAYQFQRTAAVSGSTVKANE
jgi:hypothetical protein